MRFKLNEDLEDDLIAQAQKEDQVAYQLEQLFSDNGFEVRRSINGTSYENSEGSIRASFYVDTKMNYKGYVTDDSTNSSNFSVKGNIDGAISAANKTIDQFYSLV